MKASADSKKSRRPSAGIRQRRHLLAGISGDVAELLKDKPVGHHAFQKLRKMKPIRQLEVAELMVSANNYTVSYAKALFPSIPKENRPPVPTAWSLVYVGISPTSPTSSRNIAIRLAKDHAGGNIGGSTFRQSLAALLTGSLGLEPRRGSDRSRLVSEVPLSRWIESACGVTFATAERPWEFETDVIAILNPPLNIDCGTHPFRLEVKARRAALRQACGLGA